METPLFDNDNRQLLFACSMLAMQMKLEQAGKTDCFLYRTISRDLSAYTSEELDFCTTIISVTKMINIVNLNDFDLT
jgi:hypothetical protein